MTNRVGSFWFNTVSGVAKLVFFAVLFGTISFSYQTAYAENIEYSVTIEPSLNLTIPSNLITLDLHPELTTFGSQDLTVGVSTNSAYGYQLSMSSDSTSLVDIADNNKTMPTLPAKAGGYTTNEFVANKWGYKQDDGNYIPYVSGTTLLESNAPSAGDSTTLNFAAKIDYGQAAGNYNIGLKFLAVANIGDYIVSIVNNNTTSNINFTDVPSGESKTFTVTPKSGYYLSAVSCPNGYTCSGYTTGESATGTQTITITNNDTINGGVLTLTGEPITVETCQRFGNTTLQDFDSDNLCDNQGESGILIDNRDNQSYTVAKINDQWWMTTNLNLAGGTALYSDTSNVPDGYLSTNNNPYYILPTSSTSGFSDEVTAYVYNSDSTSCGDKSPCYSYYSYAAATAGTNPSSGEAPSDICPKGWRLPTETEIVALKDTYYTGDMLTSSPFFGVYAGVYDNSSFVGGGSVVYYLSSTAYTSLHAVSLYSKSDYTGVYATTYKRYGYSLRCMMQ